MGPKILEDGGWTVRLLNTLAGLETADPVVLLCMDDWELLVELLDGLPELRAGSFPICPGRGVENAKTGALRRDSELFAGVAAAPLATLNDVAELSPLKGEIVARSGVETGTGCGLLFGVDAGAGDNLAVALFAAGVEERLGKFEGSTALRMSLVANIGRDNCWDIPNSPVTSLGL